MSKLPLAVLAALIIGGQSVAHADAHCVQRPSASYAPDTTASAWEGGDWLGWPMDAPDPTATVGCQ